MTRESGIGQKTAMNGTRETRALISVRRRQVGVKTWPDRLDLDFAG